MLINIFLKHFQIMTKIPYLNIYKEFSRFNLSFNEYRDVQGDTNYLLWYFSVKVYYMPFFPYWTRDFYKEFQLLLRRVHFFFKVFFLCSCISVLLVTPFFRDEVLGAAVVEGPLGAIQKKKKKNYGLDFHEQSKFK